MANINRLPLDSIWDGLEGAVLTSRGDLPVPPPAEDPTSFRNQGRSVVDATAALFSVGTAPPLATAWLSRDPLTLALSVVTGVADAAGKEAPLEAEASVDLDAIDSRIHAGRCVCMACSGAARFPQGRTSATVTGGSTGGTSAMPAASLQTLANYLTRDFWLEAGTYARRFNLTSSGTGAKNGVITYNVTGWANDGNGLSADRRALTREVFKLYSAVTGINFREVTGSGGDIRFTDNDSGAYAYMASGWYADSTRKNVTINYSVVNVEASWYDGRSNYNTYTPQTIFHEIGHALGLGHQGQYNYTGTPLSYATSAQFANDSWQATMMSYWDQAENTTTGASFAWLQTPMAVDWIALNDLYGGQGYSTDKAFLGDTVYGVGTSISASVSQIWNLFSTYAGVTAYTLVDGGGYDILDVSNFGANQLINLAPSRLGAVAPSVSNIGGKIGNLTIAEGTIIEAANGGSGNDSFYGNDAANTFRGNGGNDSFYDSLGSDIYYGDAGEDWLYFSESIDLLSYSLSGDSLLFSRRSGSADVDQVWKGLENLSFNGEAYTYDQLLDTVLVGPPPQPAATLSLANGVSSTVNEGTTVSIDIATTNLAPGASVYWQITGTGLMTGDFVGLPSLEGSVGTDASGKATLNFSISADATTEGDELLGFALFSDAGRTSKLADLSLTIADTSLTPTVSNLTLWGTTSSDTIIGDAGDDRIAGVLATGTSASAMGRGQIDRLTGLAGSDVFVLGDSRGVFYDDRRSGNLGTADYALINDFRSGEDMLQLRSGRYLTTTSGGNLSLYWDRNNNGSLNTSGWSRDELIAVLTGVTDIGSSDILWV